jgi:riboflavin synthase alpha subunit
MLVYGGENWALNRSEKRKIERAEMRFLRRVSGHTLTGHVRNTTICNALQLYYLEEKIEDYKNKWRNQILRMDSLKTDIKN